MKMTAVSRSLFVGMILIILDERSVKYIYIYPYEFLKHVKLRISEEG